MRKVLRHDLFRRSVLFSVSIVASTVVGIFSIPVLVSTVGASNWGLLAVTQATCQTFAVLVALGWGATGPTMVSGLPSRERKAVYRESLELRGAALVVLLPAAALLCALLTGLPPLTVALAAVTYVAPGLNASWYLIGTNRPVALFAFDAAPAILGQLAGLAAAVWIGGLDAYLICTAAFAVVGVVGSAIFVLTRQPDGSARLARRDWGGTLRSQVPGLTSSISGSLWATLPMILVQAIAPASVPVFALVDRFLKYGILALAPVLQAIQGWIPEAGAAAVPRRAGQSIAVAAGVGLVGGVGMAALASPVSSLLSLGQATIPVIVAVLAGAAFFFDAVSQVTGLATLVVLRAFRQLAFSSVLLVAGGLPVVAVLTALFGVVGTTAGLAIAAAGIATYRVSAAVRRLRAADIGGRPEVVA